MPFATDARAPTYRHVLVPLDGSRLASAAIPTAAALAQRFGADLQAVSVAESDAEIGELRVITAEALGADVDDDHIHVVVGDDPAGAIRQRADDLGNCLICLATHGRGRMGGAVVGSVARSVLQVGPSPIVAVGPSVGRSRPLSSEVPAPLSDRRMVACVDGSSASEQVLPVAAAWANALGLSLTIVTVAEPSPPPLRPGATWHRHHGPDADADAYISKLGEAWKDAAPDVGTRVVYDPISAADGLQAFLESEPAGLVAVTTHARTGLERLVLGSGATSIVHASTAPVLVVPLAG